jgi:hypothetical protein
VIAHKDAKIEQSVIVTRNTIVTIDIIDIIDMKDMKNHLLLIVQNLKDHVLLREKDHALQREKDHALQREKDHALQREKDHAPPREKNTILNPHVNHMKARKQKNASESYTII